MKMHNKPKLRKKNNSLQNIQYYFFAESSDKQNMFMTSNWYLIVFG
jgi:hypothetical protein